MATCPYQDAYQRSVLPPGDQLPVGQIVHASVGLSPGQHATA
jgi:hypothetical protein